MNNKEINTIIESLNETMYCFENLLIENEGEFTDDAQQLDEQINILKDLLTTEGIDSLGRWLKAKEDEIKSLKAEKDYITRRISAGNNTIDYIKSQMHRVMSAAGIEEIKGANGYKFQSTISKTTSVDKDILKEMFQAKVKEAVKDVIPADVTITLGASVSLLGDVEDENLPAYYQVSRSPSCKFTKPRASKKSE